MITPSVQTSLTNARRYFREHLRVGDYYTAGKAIDGVWGGEAAEKLGLKGPISARSEDQRVARRFDQPRLYSRSTT